MVVEASDVHLGFCISTEALGTHFQAPHNTSAYHSNPASVVPRTGLQHVIIPNLCVDTGKQLTACKVTNSCAEGENTEGDAQLSS